jgi:integrase
MVRVLATVGQEEMKKLTPDVEFFFIEQKNTFLGESYKKPGEVMHEKAWIFYINKQIKKAKENLKITDVLSSHSFRVGFVTRHLKHADSHLVSKFVGHKNIATTLKYNRYVVDENKVREILDKGYQEQGSLYSFANKD